MNIIIYIYILWLYKTKNIHKNLKNLCNKTFVEKLLKIFDNTL